MAHVRSLLAALALFVLALSPLCQFASAASGPVAYWSFDELSSATVEDVSGSGNEASIHGTVSIDGVRGEALCFDGEGDYVDARSFMSFRGNGSFSFEFCMRPMNLTRSMRILSKIDIEGGPAMGPGLLVATGASRTITVLLASDYRNGSYIMTDSEAEVSEGRWSHVVVAYDGSLRASGVRVYIDGNASGMSVVRDDLAGEIDNTVPFLIGTNVGEEGYAFEGGLDEFRVYDRALDQASVRSSYESIRLDLEESNAEPEEDTTEEEGSGSTDIDYLPMDQVIGALVIAIVGLLVVYLYARRGGGQEPAREAPPVEEAVVEVVAEPTADSVRRTGASDRMTLIHVAVNAVEDGLQERELVVPQCPAYHRCHERAALQ